MLEKMVKDILAKLMRTVYPHLLRPAVMYARIVTAVEENTVVGAAVELKTEDGGVIQGYLQEHWYRYTVRILDRDGAEHPSYSPIPGVRSKVTLHPGQVAAVVMPYGDLVPVIVGEVAL